VRVEDEFLSINPKDLWVYNKLQLSRLLNYNCGPVGMNVHSSGLYIVRPSINFLGMSRNARKIHLKPSVSTEDLLHPGEFWCEIFKGEHLSVDFHYYEPVLVVKGFRNLKKPLYKWTSWCKVSRFIKFPEILNDLKGHYEWINCEFIGDKLIEVHFRPNPDFRYENHVAIPVWKNENIKTKFDSSFNMKFIEDFDYERLGFWIK